MGGSQNLKARLVAIETDNARLRAENEKLRAALKPFSDCIYNDNGDVTITTSDAVANDYWHAYCVLKGKG
jgi:regulator of replication initiation timing